MTDEPRYWLQYTIPTRIGWLRQRDHRQYHFPNFQRRSQRWHAQPDRAQTEALALRRETRKSAVEENTGINYGRKTENNNEKIIK